jgi:hypothetical protein
MYYAEDEHQHAVVEVIMPEADPHAVSSSAASASSVTQDVASLIEKAIAKLPPDLAEQAKDVKRKAKLVVMCCFCVVLNY